MSDELDRELLRRFAQASESLPDTRFHAGVMFQVRRDTSPWHNLPGFVASSLRLTGSGFLTGMRALFRLRLGGVGILALLMGAVAGALAMLGA